MRWAAPVLAKLAALCLLVPALVSAQEIEPRAYTNLPVGLNFLAVGYGQSTGGLSTDPSLPVEDAKLRIHTGVVAYVRSLDLWGRSGKVDVILPYSQLSGSALVSGRFATRDVSGLGDPRFRWSFNFHGAPSLSLQEFSAYRQDLVLGGSLQVTVPTGQYDRSKAINLGSNRWSFKPDLGFSKAFGALLVDLTAGVTFFTANDEFLGSQRLTQAPIYSLQGNVSYTLAGGIWASLGGTYYRGGRTTLDGALKDNALGNSRAGLTLSVPINRHHSVKFNASGGLSTRTGANFEALGVAWQYRWGAGL